MRPLMTLFGMCAIVALLFVGAAVALLVQLLPYIVMGMVIGALLRRRHCRSTPATYPVYRATEPSQSAPTLPPPGWVYLPVWVGPPPRQPMPVLDGQVIGDRRGE